MFRNFSVAFLYGFEFLVIILIMDANAESAVEHTC